MKRILSIVLFCMTVVFLFSGCSVTPKLEEEKIKNDIIAKAELTNFDREITDFVVIKRQTNLENKEDIVYVSFAGENEHYSFVKNFRAVYILYNDGWILEELDEYSDDVYEDYAIAKHGVEDLGSWGVTEFVGSFKYDEDRVWVASFAIEETSAPEMDKNHGKHCFHYVIWYDYRGVKETVTVPVEYYFRETADGDWAWQMGYVPESRYQRELSFNSAIEGRWVNHYVINATGEEPNKYSNSSVDVSITDSTEDTAHMVYTRKYRGDLEESYEGTVRLSYEIDQNSGKISNFYIEPEQEGYDVKITDHYGDANYLYDSVGSHDSLARIEKY